MFKNRKTSFMHKKVPTVIPKTLEIILGTSEIGSG